MKAAKKSLYGKSAEERAFASFIHDTNRDLWAIERQLKLLSDRHKDDLVIIGINSLISRRVNAVKGAIDTYYREWENGFAGEN